MNDQAEAEKIAKQFIGSGSDVAGRIGRCADAILAYGEAVRDEMIVTMLSLFGKDCPNCPNQGWYSDGP